jgi:hypothetical protein
LRAGDAWLEGSRRYANPESYLIPPVRWPDLRPEVCALTQTSEDGAARLRERQAELEMLLRRLDDEFGVWGATEQRKQLRSKLLSLSWLDQELYFLWMTHL